MEDTEEEFYDFNYTSEICDGEEETLQTFYAASRPALYGLISLLGLAGNGLMVAVLLRRRRRLRVTEIYLLHLALADLMLIFTLPFNVVESVAGWVFGDFLCMLNGVLRNLNLLCGTFLLAYIGFDRYLAVVHAVPSLHSRRPRKVNLICALLWLLSLLLSLPNAVFLSASMYTNESRADCHYYRFENHAHNWVVANRLVYHASFFFSLAVMCYCYATIAVTLFRGQKSQAKKGAVRLALLVTLAFCVCWLPFNVTLLVKTLADFEVVAVSCASMTLVNQVDAVTEGLGVLHCCLNPFLYAFVGVQFRNELLLLLCRLGCGRFFARFVRPQDYRGASVSDGTSNSTVMY